MPREEHEPHPDAKLCAVRGIVTPELYADAARRIEEQLGSSPWHAEKAAKDPDYWHRLAASRPLA